MSEPAPKRQPLIDLYEFERRMRGEFAPAHGDEEIFEREAEASAAAAEPEHAPIMAFRQTFPLPTAAEERAIAFEPAAPVIGGDFAEIEAALLRAARITAPAAEPARPDASGQIILPALRATRDQEDEPFAFASAPFSALAGESDEGQAAAFSALGDERLLTQAPLDHFVYVDDAAVSGEAALYEEEKRSRRPLYLMAAVVIAGVAGIITSSALKRDTGSDDRSEPMQTAAIAPAASASDIASPASPAPPVSAEAPAPQFATTGQAPTDAATADAAPAPAAASAVALQDAATPPAAAMGSLLAPPPYGAAHASTAAAPAPASVAQAPAAPAPAALAEPKKVKTASVRPDGTIAKAETAAHVAARDAGAKDATKDAVVKTAAKESAKPALAKTAALPAPRPAKVAAKPADGAAKTAHNDANAHAKSAASTPEPQPVQVASAPVEPSPAPKANPLAFVDTAVSSITGATTKLLDWTRSATNLTHN